MKKTNILFVSLVMVAALAGNAFCTKVQDNAKELKNSILFLAEEDSKILKTALSEENNKKNHNAVDPSFERIILKLAKVKRTFPNSAGSISAILGDIKEIISRLEIGGTGEFVSQNLLTPVESLSTHLVSLRKQDIVAFNATVGVIDTKYNVEGDSYSIYNFYEKTDRFLPSLVEIRDTDGLIRAMQADALSDVSNRLTQLQKEYPSQKHIGLVKEKIQYFAFNIEKLLTYKNKEDAQNFEGNLEDLESVLRELRETYSHLFDIVSSIINREYNTKTKSSYSISTMVFKVNEIFSNAGLPSTAEVYDPERILISMDAYSPLYK
jgi:hypothetical protein